jgi:hypothetical protein
MPEVDAAFGKIVGRHFDRNPIAGENADAVLFHSAGRIGQGFMAVVEPYAEACVGKKFEDGSFEFDQFFFSQKHFLSLFRKAGDAEASPQSRLCSTPPSN